MAEPKSIDNYLLAARDILKSSLEKSRDIDVSIGKSGCKFEEINQKISSLDAAIENIACGCTLYGIRDKIDRTIGPASAAVKVFDSVCEIASSLSVDDNHYRSNLYASLSSIKRLEEALKFLTGNCELVILWLEDVALSLEDNRNVDADNLYYLNVKKSLGILGQLYSVEKCSLLEGGILSVAFSKLENEFRHLLTYHTFPLPVAPCTIDDQPSSVGVNIQPLPLTVVDKLHAILERLAAGNQLHKCISIYIEVRSSNARTALQALDLDYLDIIPLSEFDSMQSIETCIDQWGKHLDFTVTHVLELEHRLCHDIFQKFGFEVWTDCFAKIAVQSGIQAFLKFGSSVTGGKKEAIKLLKLMEIFAALDKLRMDFNRLFGCKACVDIQNQTRDLIEKVVNGTCEIFWELSVQVELQRKSSPPADGSVPRLVSFVTDYCNELLEDKYKSTLTHVLDIHQSWTNFENLEKGEQLVSGEILKIIKALELNLETWAKRYKDTSLSSLFLMNSHWYLCNNISGTKLGDLMGYNWLKGHEEQMEHYIKRYMEESWGKIVPLLSEEDLILFGERGRAIVRDLDHLVKKRMQTFGEAFEDMYKKQSNWVVCDKGLRWKTCQHVAEVVLPVYRNFIQNYLLPQQTSIQEFESCISLSSLKLELTTEKFWWLFEDGKDQNPLVT